MEKRYDTIACDITDRTSASRRTRNDGSQGTARPWQCRGGGHRIARHSLFRRCPCSPQTSQSRRFRWPCYHRAAVAHRGRGRRGRRRNHGWRRTGPRWPGHDPGRYDRSSPGARQSPDPFVVRHDVFPEPGSEGTATLSGLGSVRQGFQRIPRQRKDRQSTSSVEAPPTRRQASAETDRRSDSSYLRRSQLSRSRRPGAYP